MDRSSIYNAPSASYPPPMHFPQLDIVSGHVQADSLPAGGENLHNCVDDTYDPLWANANRPMGTEITTLNYILGKLPEEVEGDDQGWEENYPQGFPEGLERTSLSAMRLAYAVIDRKFTKVRGSGAWRNCPTTSLKIQDLPVVACIKRVSQDYTEYTKSWLRAHPAQIPKTVTSCLDDLGMRSTDPNTYLSDNQLTQFVKALTLIAKRSDKVGMTIIRKAPTSACTPTVLSHSLGGIPWPEHPFTQENWTTFADTIQTVLRRNFLFSHYLPPSKTNIRSRQGWLRLTYEGSSIQDFLTTITALHKRHSEACDAFRQQPTTVGKSKSLTRLFNHSQKAKRKDENARDLSTFGLEVTNEVYDFDLTAMSIALEALASDARAGKITLEWLNTILKAGGAGSWSSEH